MNNNHQHSSERENETEFLAAASRESWVFFEPPSDVLIKQRDAELEAPAFKSFDPRAQMWQILGGVDLGVFSQVSSSSFPRRGRVVAVPTGCSQIPELFLSAREPGALSAALSQTSLRSTGISSPIVRVFLITPNRK